MNAPFRKDWSHWTYGALTLYLTVSGQDVMLHFRANFIHFGLFSDSQGVTYISVSFTSVICVSPSVWFTLTAKCVEAWLFYGKKGRDGWHVGRSVVGKVSHRGKQLESKSGGMQEWMGGKLQETEAHRQVRNESTEGGTVNKRRDWGWGRAQKWQKK